MVDPQPVHQAFTEPANDLFMGLVKDPGNLNAHSGQGVNSKEPAVVQVSVGPAPADQLIVLPLMDLARAIPGRVRSFGQRETVIVVPQFVVHHLQLVKVVVTAQDRDADLPAAEVPVDVESLGVF
ncbi:hypothetical protein D3C73_1191090 [compost metagenome]